MNSDENKEVFQNISKRLCKRVSDTFFISFLTLSTDLNTFAHLKSVFDGFWKTALVSSKFSNIFLMHNKCLSNIHSKSLNSLII